MTAAEAIQTAVDWAEGRRSHINELMHVEAGPEHRASTLALCAQADAQEVVKWSALAVALLDFESHTEISGPY